MIHLDQETLRRLQLTELEILREADRVARKHGIPYCVIAGTLLGAVRHGGFIPWDDDADIALPRKDYERFRAACLKELDPERFYFQDHEITEGYRWGYGKLRMRGTLFLREHQEHMPYEQGVFIDVFPLDPVPQRQIGRSLMNFECFLVRKFLWARVGKVADRSGAKRVLYRLMDLAPERAVKGWLNGLIRKSGRIRSSWVRILMFPTPNRKYGYLRKWYLDPAPTVFEGETFSGVRDAEEYLTFKFGNYRELPPAEARKTHPVSAIRLPETLADPKKRENGI